MILIADSGSTKTDWSLIGSEGKIFPLHTEGLNPYFKTIEQIRDVVLTDLIPKMPCKSGDMKNIYFYGSGCSVPVRCEEVKKALSACFTSAEIEVEHDILGAARACCGRESGIVSILGTGSNSCCYNGEEITEIIGGLGYILGDEGSGSHIGKSILSAFLNHEMPEDLKNQFLNAYHLGKAEIDKSVYLKPNANRFIASFSLFAEKNKTHTFIQNLLENCFEIYINEHICRYKNYRDTVSHFVGSVAFYNRDMINELCAERNIKTGKFLLEPIEGLLEYHQ